MEPSSESLERVAIRHGIILLLQFGSTVAGTARAGSDLDLAVSLREPPRSLQEHTDLLCDLQQIFPEREVDLVVIQHADPLLLRKITESARLLFGSERDLRQLEIYAFKRYQDHRRFLDMDREYVERYLAEESRR